MSTEYLERVSTEFLKRMSTEFLNGVSTEYRPEALSRVMTRSSSELRDGCSGFTCFKIKVISVSLSAFSRVLDIQTFSTKRKRRSNKKQKENLRKFDQGYTTNATQRATPLPPKCSLSSPRNLILLYLRLTCEDPARRACSWRRYHH